MTQAASLLTRQYKEYLVGTLSQKQGEHYVRLSSSFMGNDFLTALYELREAVEEGGDEVSEVLASHLVAFSDSGNILGYDALFRELKVGIPDELERNEDQELLNDAGLYDITDKYKALFMGTKEESKNHLQINNEINPLGYRWLGSTRGGRNGLHHYWSPGSNDVLHLEGSPKHAIRTLKAYLLNSGSSKAEQLREEYGPNFVYSIPEGDIPSQEHPPFVEDISVKKYQATLEESRQFRKSARRRNMSEAYMRTDLEPYGTRYKFVPFFKNHLAGVYNSGNSTTVVVIGTGALPVSGIMCAVVENFPDHRIIAIDPAIQKHAWSERHEIHEMYFDPDNNEHIKMIPPNSLVVTDVSIASQDSFCSETSKEFMQKLSSKLDVSTDALFKLNISDLRDVKSVEIFYTKGHNHECFVVNPHSPAARYLSAEKYEELFELKKRCDAIRNCKILMPQINIMPSNAAFAGGISNPRVAVRLSPGRKYSRDRTRLDHGDTFASIANLIGDDPKRFQHDDLRQSIALLIQKAAGYHPNIPISQLGINKRSFVDYMGLTTKLQSDNIRKGRPNRRQRKARSACGGPSDGAYL